MISLIRKLLGIYAFILLLDFALPFLTDAQKPWMTWIHKISEPGIKAGNRVAARLFPDRRVKMDIGALAGIVLCLAARLVLSFFL